jgi:hypothetical protein
MSTEIRISLIAAVMEARLAARLPTYSRLLWK